MTDAEHAINLLDRAALALSDRNIPPFALGVIDMIALGILSIIASSPEDEAERFAAIAQIMRRTGE